MNRCLARRLTAADVSELLCVAAASSLFIAKVNS